MKYEFHIINYFDRDFNTLTGYFMRVKVCNLKVGDVITRDLIFHEVYKIENGLIYFKSMHHKGNYLTHLSSNSKEFVLTDFNKYEN